MPSLAFRVQNFMEYLQKLYFTKKYLAYGLIGMEQKQL